MSKQDDLFSFIQSLNQSEKRYIHLYLKTFVGQKETNVLKLYTYLVKQSTYNIEKLKKDFKGEPFLRQLYKVKKELKEKVSQCLYLYNLGMEKNSSLLRLKHRINELSIFYNKSLLHQTSKQIKQLKKQAYKLETYTDLLICLDWEERVILDSKERKPLEKLSKVYEERKKALSLLVELNKYKELLNQIAAISNIQTHGRSGVKKQEVIQFLEKHQLHKKPDILTPIISFYYHNTLATAYMIISKSAKSYLHSEKCWQLALNHQFVFIGDNNYKIKILMNLLNSLHQNRMTDKHYSYLELLKNEPEIDRLHHYEKKAFIYIHELININMKREYEKGDQLMLSMKQQLDEYVDHISTSQLQNIYAISLNLSLVLENYDLAYFWNERILSQKVSDIRFDLKQFAQLIQLLILHQNAQEIDIENNFRSVQRYFNQNKNVHPFYTCSLWYFKKLFLTPLSNKDRKVLLNQFRKEIEIIDQTPDAGNAYGMSYLYFWAKSQVVNQPLVQVLQNEK